MSRLIKLIAVSMLGLLAVIGTCSAIFRLRDRAIGPDNEANEVLAVPSEKSLFLEASRKQISVDSPMFEKLLLVHSEAYGKYPSKSARGLDRLGLIFRKMLVRPEYDWSTPGNCVAFAGTGGDGVTFSFLVLHDKIDDICPIVMTLPANGSLSYVVGENLFDFLCLGSRRGFFCLEQLSYQRDVAIQAFTDSNWQPTEKEHFSVGFGVEEYERNLLNFLSERCQLKPWSDPKRFDYLQSRYGPLVARPKSN